MIHNHEVRSSILRPATRKRHHRILCGVFLYARTLVRQGRSQYTMRAGSQWDTDEDGMPAGMAGDKSDSTVDSNHGVFLGNKHLRSKSGLEGGTEWRLKHPATRYKKTTLQIPLRFFLLPARTKSVRIRLETMRAGSQWDTDRYGRCRQAWQATNLYPNRSVTVQRKSRRFILTVSRTPRLTKR